MSCLPYPLGHLGGLEREKYATFLSFHPPEWGVSLPFNGLWFLPKMKPHTLRSGEPSPLCPG